MIREKRGGKIKLRIVNLESSEFSFFPPRIWDLPDLTHCTLHLQPIKEVEERKEMQNPIRRLSIFCRNLQMHFKMGMCLWNCHWFICTCQARQIQLVWIWKYNTLSQNIRPPYWSMLKCLILKWPYTANTALIECVTSFELQALNCPTPSSIIVNLIRFKKYLPEPNVPFKIFLCINSPFP